MIKKVIKSGGHRAHFDFTMLTNTAILDPLNRAQPKIRQKAEIFSKMHLVSQSLTSLYCLSTCIPEKCLLIPLFLLYAPK